MTVLLLLLLLLASRSVAGVGATAAAQAQTLQRDLGSPKLEGWAERLQRPGEQV